MAAHQLELGTVRSEPFTLQRIQDPHQGTSATLHIYLGGDGRPWLSDRPSLDPSGQRLLALELMVQDPAPAVYLGRPCYHRHTMSAACQPELWTSQRYSETVIASMAAAMRTEIERFGATEVVLIGYSGGGSIAVLAAPRLVDLAEISVITLAANLDIAAWAGFHRLLPLTGSLNPSEQAPSGVSEIHLQGEDDEVVPVATVARYSHRHPLAKFVYVEGFDHRCCWGRYWPQILPRALKDQL